jgi:hypothetical protein
MPGSERARTFTVYVCPECGAVHGDEVPVESETGRFYCDYVRDHPDRHPTVESVKVCPVEDARAAVIAELREKAEQAPPRDPYLQYEATVIDGLADWLERD